MLQRGTMSPLPQAPSPTLVIGSRTNFPTGFEHDVAAKSSLDFNAITGAISITYSADCFVYIQGKGFKKLAGSTDTQTGAATWGCWYAYYDTAGALQISSAVPDVFAYALVASVFRNTTDAFWMLFDERHKVDLTPGDHYHKRNVIGGEYVSGFSPSGYIPSTPSDAGVTYGITGGVCANHDIFITSVDDATPDTVWEQILSDPAEIPILYRNGAGGVWNAEIVAGFQHKYGATPRPSYNNVGVGFAEVPAGYFVNYYLVWMPCYKNSLSAYGHCLWAIAGQGNHATVLAANNTNINEISVAVFPSGKVIPLYKIVYQNATGGTSNTQLVSITSLKTATAAGGLEIPLGMSHTALSERGTPNQHPSSALFPDGTMSGELNSGAETDLWLALQRIDLFDSNLQWVTASVYRVGNIVRNSRNIYRCITAHTAGASFTADSQYWEMQGAGAVPGLVQTTDATPTTLCSVTIGTGASARIWADVHARSGNDTLAVKIDAVAENIAGATSIAIQSRDIYQDDGDWDVNLDTATADVRVRVIGKAATTITWEGRIHTSTL